MYVCCTNTVCFTLVLLDFEKNACHIDISMILFQCNHVDSYSVHSVCMQAGLRVRLITPISLVTNYCCQSLQSAALIMGDIKGIAPSVNFVIHVPCVIY